MTITRADVQNPPPFLPPRRPSSLPNLLRRDSSWRVPAEDPPLRSSQRIEPFISGQPTSLVTRLQLSARERPFSDSALSTTSSVRDAISRPQSFQSFSSGDTATFSESSLQHTPSLGSDRLSRHRRKLREDSPAQTPRLAPIQDGQPLRTASVRGPLNRQSALTRSPLHVESRLFEDDFGLPHVPPPVLKISHKDSRLCSDDLRPQSHRQSNFGHPTTREHSTVIPGSLLSCADDGAPSLPPSRTSSTSSQILLGPKPRASFIRLSSLDNLMTFRDEQLEWKQLSRSSSMIHPVHLEADAISRDLENDKTFGPIDRTTPSKSDVEVRSIDSGARGSQNFLPEELKSVSPTTGSKFRHFAAEISFCFTIAMTQFLAEYLISGFAIELPKLLSSTLQVDRGSMGVFWPASLLSLILSATLLIWARLSDMYSGYFIFMFGVAWLAIWTLIPGFCRTTIWLDVSRAMQGLAIAAFMPSTFSMVGSIYPEGPRRNFVLGLYSGCAPLGFFAGFLIAAALPEAKAQWYFFVASILAVVTFVTAYLSVPSDRTDRCKLGLKMDWIGSFLIMSGLILVSYALAIEPYANQLNTEESGFGFPSVTGPFVSGIGCLAIAFWYEGWYATCPLLPFDFFAPKSVKPFSLACLCFYASYGVWLYNSAEYFQSPESSGTGHEGPTGITLALWYIPTAVGGIVLCIVGGALMHIVPMMALLLFSALAWIFAPLLLALAPLPLQYWSYVMPSMLCATMGIDLTFTVSIVFLSSVQPLRYQGLSGAVCSILVNLAMSFALSISGIVMERAEGTTTDNGNTFRWEYQATFVYGAASAGLGLLICLFFVRISRSVVRDQPPDEERPRATSSESTLVNEGAGGPNGQDSQESVGMRQVGAIKRRPRV